MPAGAISYLTQSQVQDLLDHILSTRDRAIFTVAYWRGLRASEVGQLRVDDYRADVKRLFVRRVKGGTSAEYVLCPAEVQALNAWLKVRGTDPGPMFVARGSAPISRQRLHNLMRNHAAILGFPPDRRHFHCLRHSIATHLVEQGMDIMMIRDWLGHRDIASTMVYARVTNPTRDRASERLYKAISDRGASPTTPEGGKMAGRAGSGAPGGSVAKHQPPKVGVSWARDARKGPGRAPVKSPVKKSPGQVRG